VIAWDELPDLAPYDSREALDLLCRQTYADSRPKTVTNWVGQIWAFRGRIEVGDLVVLPLKTQSAIAIGRVTGPYRYRPDLADNARHTRPVEWLWTDIPRSAFDSDLLYSLGAFMTVCQIQRNQAEQRIQALLAGSSKPVSPSSATTIEAENPADVAAPVNIEEYAADQIRTHIGQKFRGHGLARLVTALLEAQGYRTIMSPPGADGGVDVIAGGGPMGFDSPRICVQVKSSDQPLDVNELRQLQGVMDGFGAERGLLVAWGGFRQSVLSDARRLFFKIRLWDAGDLVSVLLEHYDRLPADLQAELPLKRIWTLVLEE
jgi:restriction system protein